MRKSIVSQRITLPPAHTAYDSRSSNAETIMKHYIERNVINPTDVKRRIATLSLAANKNRGSNVSWQSRFKNLAEEMSEISLLTGLGWNIVVDYKAKKWIFDVMTGRNLTANQSVNPPVIFSPQFDSIKNLSYVESELNYKNMAYVAGQGEGVERRVVQLHDNITGINRHELFIDARDIAETDDDEQPLPEQQIIKALTDRGKQQLQEFLQEQYLEGQILTQSSFKYEKDFDLGDIVTVQNKDWGVTLDTRITEVTEVYESSGFQLEAVFGNNRPTLIDKIKQGFQQMKPEIYK